MSKDWRAYALPIPDAIERIRQIHQRGDLTRDQVLYDAALRNLQTLSEATQRLPEDLKESYPVILWKQISGFRNILVHNYLGEIDPHTVLTALRDHLPPLEAAIRAMLATGDAEPLHD